MKFLSSKKDMLLIIISTIFYSFILIREYKPELMGHKSDVVKKAEKVLASQEYSSFKNKKISKADAKRIVFKSLKSQSMINADIILTYVKDGLKFSPIFISTILLNKNLYIEYCFSYILYFVITKTLKKVVKKNRPDGLNMKSFPSGHAASAFLGSGFFLKAFGPYFGYPAIILASAVSISRVYAKRHTTLDVLVGAMIGFFCGFFIKFKI